MVKFKEKSTGRIWDIYNEEHIKHFRSNPRYEEIKESIQKNIDNNTQNNTENKINISNKNTTEENTINDNKNKARKEEE